MVFTYSFIALWVRIITIIVLSIPVVIVVLGIGYTIKSLIAPDINTVDVVYESELSVSGLNKVKYYEFILTKMNKLCIIKL